MKNLILIIFALTIFSCEKKKQLKPSTTTPTGSVWCFYQTNYGGKAFLFCASTQDEYQQKQKQCIDNNLQVIVETKVNCQSCQ